MYPFAGDGPGSKAFLQLHTVGVAADDAQFLHPEAHCMQCAQSESR